MLNLPQSVTRALPMIVSAATGEAELDSELRYDPDDPFAVSLAIGVECGDPVVWVFARDLLAAGIGTPTGLGDITIEPADDDQSRQLRITLATDSLATLLVPRDPVVEFLVDTFAIVPTGSESERIDLDAEIASLLG